MTGRGTATRDESMTGRAAAAGAQDESKIGGNATARQAHAAPRYWRER
jgi:hypothetical protein